MAATPCTGSRSLSKLKQSVGAVLLAISLLLPGDAPAQQQQSGQQQSGLPPPIDETPEDLPPGKGREETFYACVVCHGSAIIRQQGMSRDRWDQTLDWMTERHGMAPPEPDERALIVDYLATAFPSRRRGRPNPFLQNQ